MTIIAQVSVFKRATVAAWVGRLLYAYRMRYCRRGRVSSGEGIERAARNGRGHCRQHLWVSRRELVDERTQPDCENDLTDPACHSENTHHPEQCEGAEQR